MLDDITRGSGTDSNQYNCVINSYETPVIIMKVQFIHSQ